MLRKIGIIAVLSLIIAAVAAVPALAANPHFLSVTTPNPAINGSGELTVNFRIAGLGNDIATVPVTLHADATAVYACRNNGGNFPSDPKKQTRSDDVFDTERFPVRNGSARGTIQLSPPESTLDCPGGQREVLARVTYTNVRISAAGETETVGSGTFSRTFFNV